MYLSRVVGTDLHALRHAWHDGRRKCRRKITENSNFFGVAIKSLVRCREFSIRTKNGDDMDCEVRYAFYVRRGGDVRAHTFNPLSVSWIEARIWQ